MSIVLAGYFLQNMDLCETSEIPYKLFLLLFLVVKTFDCFCCPMEEWNNKYMVLLKMCRY